MNSRKFLSIISALLFLFSIQNSFASIESNESIEQSILRNVNTYRLQKGLKPLKINPLISAEAKKHSANMSRHAVGFGHTHFRQRIKNICARLQDCRGGAENVAYAYKDGNIVVKQWLTSPAHKRNIDGNYNLTGIGVARDARGKLYFTQLFVRTPY